jgi:hypothetical protein
MSLPISFRCPACKVRIKAPAQLAGRARPCPGCRSLMVIPRRVPSDAESCLVAVDTGGDFMRIQRA